MAPEGASYGASCLEVISSPEKTRRENYETTSPFPVLPAVTVCSGYRLRPQKKPKYTSGLKAGEILLRASIQVQMCPGALKGEDRSFPLSAIWNLMREEASASSRGQAGLAKQEEEGKISHTSSEEVGHLLRMIFVGRKSEEEHGRALWGGGGAPKPNLASQLGQATIIMLTVGGSPQGSESKGHRARRPKEKSDPGGRWDRHSLGRRAHP